MSGKLRLYFFLCILLLVFGTQYKEIAQNSETEEEIVGAKLTASPVSVSPGEKLTLNVTLKLLDGAHANSNKPDDPYLIPTVFIPDKIEGIVWGEIKYPEPTKVTETYSLNPLLVFEDGAEILVPVTITSSISAKQIKISGILRIQACDHEQCYPAKKIPLAIVIPVKENNAVGERKEIGIKKERLLLASVRNII